jgi:hypothetical protein
MKVGDVVAFRSSIRRYRMFGVIQKIHYDESNCINKINILYRDANGDMMLTARYETRVETPDELRGQDLTDYHAYILGCNPKSI